MRLFAAEQNPAMEDYERKMANANATDVIVPMAMATRVVEVCTLACHTRPANLKREIQPA